MPGVLLALGTWYASALGLAEIEYASGQWFKQESPPLSIQYFRRSAQYFPLQRVFRTASALTLGAYARHYRTSEWLVAARAELEWAWVADPSAPDLLAQLVVICFEQKDDDAARFYLQLLMQVARASPFITSVLVQSP